MVAEIETYLDQLLSIKQDVPGIVAGLSDVQLNWRPAQDRWSIAECLEHLNVSADLFLGAIDRRLEQGRASGMLSPGPFAYGAFERWWVRNAEPPPRRRFRAPSKLRPPATQLNGDVVRRFLERQDAVGERLRRADGLDLRRIRVRTVLPLFTMTLGQTFALVLAHERRHVWQARQVRNDPAFPRSG